MNDMDLQSEQKKEANLNIFWKNAYWNGVGKFRTRIVLEEDNNECALNNYNLVTENWHSLWAEMTYGAEDRMQAYKTSVVELNPEVDYFDVQLPSNLAIGNSGVEWSLLLQSRRGWLLIFDGFKYVGGQAIF
jgi:hypothetical protein